MSAAARDVGGARAGDVGYLARQGKPPKMPASLPWCQKPGPRLRVLENHRPLEVPLVKHAVLDASDGKDLRKDGIYSEVWPFHSDLACARDTH